MKAIIKKLSLIFLILLGGLNLKGQMVTIDTVYVLSNNTPPTLQIEGKYSNTGGSITYIDVEVFNDTTYFRLFFKECAGFLAITPFDTIYQLSNTWPVVPNTIVVISIIDTNTIDTLNCFYHSNIQVMDTFYIYNTLNTSEIEIITKEMNIYPNPAKKLLNLKINNNLKIQTIELFDLNGRHVKTYKANERELSLKGLPPGQYLLELNTDKGKVTKKVIVE